MVRRRRRKYRRRRKKKNALNLAPETQRMISGTGQITAGILLYLVLNQDAGMVGESMSTAMAFFFGAWSGIFPAFLIISGLLHWFTRDSHFEAKRSIGLVLCLLSFLGIVHIGAPLEEIASNRDALAGSVGFMMSLPFLVFTSRAVGYTVLTALFISGLFISFEPDFADIRSWIDSLKKKKKKQRRRRVVDEEDEYEEDEEDEDEYEEDEEDPVEDDQEEPELNIVRPAFAQSSIKDRTKKVLSKKVKDTLQMKDTRFEEWTFPGYDLLDGAQSELKVDDAELKKQAKLIEEKLEEFDIDVTMRDAHPGPTVTQFTLKPAEGVKLSKIAALKDDLALALAAPSLRIEAPIPGKSLVGIEMPNTDRTLVHLREIMESIEFTESDSPLTLPLGRDVSGKAVVAPLNDMPHLLIAGATGSGKSVCMNSFLASLLFQNAPHELKLILIDPKRVELMPYDGIPHLLTPVITEAERALQALRWAVAEMGRRLHRFSEAGVRNLDEYNEKQEKEESYLPRVVIVVDELADLMMRQYRRDTETMVARIAQMARATGMHLIIATQRPSVDVITGLIKANIPTRIAFRTVSAVDSRTILDSIGAEDLLGRGDMLYMTAETSSPIRIQGILVTGKEVQRVINSVKIAGGGKVTEQIEMDGDREEGEEGGSGGYIDLDADDNGGDDMFFEAVRVVQETGKASASLLQRQLKVGYARAARLLDIMEDRGLIGPSNGAKAREVYIDKVAES
ncbi:MAG: DNA translocase FtsK [Candidatus Peribacteraceae bacterium]|nr:cell division protein FtsK [bacterium]MDP6561694.1 DNA translocase FtsK [Candidatus Peribacteraceae bacterium]